MGELVEGETFVEWDLNEKKAGGFMRWQAAADKKRTNASVFLAALPWEIVGTTNVSFGARNAGQDMGCIGFCFSHHNACL